MPLFNIISSVYHTREVLKGMDGVIDFINSSVYLIIIIRERVWGSYLDPVRLNMAR